MEEKDDLLDFFDLRKPFPKVYIPVCNFLFKLAAMTSSKYLGASNFGPSQEV